MCMQKQKTDLSSFSVTASALALVLATSFGCAPARWAEQYADGANNQNGGGGGPAASPKKTSEEFHQDANANKVDILIVNDNSASMDEEQQKMSVRFTSFVSDLSGLDYRIAMTTTDLDSPKYNLGGRIVSWSGTTAKVLTPATVDADTKFKNTIKRTETIGCTQRKDCPSKNEQPLRAIELAVDQARTANQDLFRDGVDFVTVILSDEDELSTAPAGATTAAHVMQHFKSTFNETKRFEVHGLVVMPGDETCLKIQGRQGPVGSKSSFGTRVADLSVLTKGSLHSICDSDYAKDLSAISTQVRKLVSSFELKSTPNPSSVSVVLTPAFKTKWTTEGNRLIFAPAPPAGTKIDVTYTYQD